MRKHVGGALRSYLDADGCLGHDEDACENLSKMIKSFVRETIQHVVGCYS